ncbi:MAG TPA: TonB-dependent receptor [Bacteroidales bacterium]|nr:TonB-dependent receptor [Bacteroidales bacterium]
MRNLFPNMKRIFLSIVALALTLGLFSQSTVNGTVKAGDNNDAVSFAAVILDSEGVTGTGPDGTFVLKNVPAGKHIIKVKMLGYEEWKGEFEITENQSLNLDIILNRQEIEKEGVVVTATRTENFINDIPVRVNLVTPRLIKATPALVMDDFLSDIPGININRAFGIISTKATITMRGLSGLEQARVLVMIDGVPVNNSDGGSVNWNLLDPDMIERIEVVKGPVSSIYGCDAMGGAINILTRKPDNGFSGHIRAGYGTFNTRTGRLNLSDKKSLNGNRSFYWMANGFYRSSDGYITQSEADRSSNPYIVPSYLKEYSAELKGGYEFDDGGSLDVDLIYYDDHRGTGETIKQPGGNSTDHDTYQARTRYYRSEGEIDYNISLYVLDEKYRKVTEFMKGSYTYYDVVSDRLDMGMLSTITVNHSRYHKLSAGIDVKQGSVDARDKYYTSTDVVYNQGKMFNAGLFLQDEMTTTDGRVKIVSGVRYDLAKYYDGAFTIKDPSSVTSYMAGLQNPSFKSKIWNAFTPKISVNYSVSDDSRLYMSVGRGFRPSVLEDLCRSGKTKGGFKLANPEVSPEYITSFEAGGDLLTGKFLRTSISLYYSIGTDFMYFVNSGDSLTMGSVQKPIYIRTNIPRVDICGAEAEINYKPLKNVTLNASYTFNYSKIIRYKKLDVNDNVDLTGKHLTDVPYSKVSLTGRWQNRFADLSISYRWQDMMWVNDQNIYDATVGSDRYPDYSTVDIRISKEIRFLGLSFDVQNLFDTEFFDFSRAVCPGRFITASLSVKF